MIHAACPRLPAMMPTAFPRRSRDERCCVCSRKRSRSLDASVTTHAALPAVPVAFQYRRSCCHLAAPVAFQGRRSSLPSGGPRRVPRSAYMLSSHSPCRVPRPTPLAIGLVALHERHYLTSHHDQRLTIMLPSQRLIALRVSIQLAC